MIEKAKHEIDAHRRENAADLKERDRLTRENAWIEVDKHIFGRINSPYDFEHRNPAKG